MTISIDAIFRLDRQLANLQDETQACGPMGPEEVGFIELCNVHRQVLAHHAKAKRSDWSDPVESAFRAAAVIREIADELESSAIVALRT